MNNYTEKDKMPIAKNLARLKLKFCGMQKNTAEVAVLNPDYLGFIFWKPSKRFFEDTIPSITEAIKKVGVFVNESEKMIIQKVKQHHLGLVQLHGEESPDFCKQLKEQIPHIKIIKVFSIKDDFDFSLLKYYEEICDFYLFDTKGKLPGGNGYSFNWEVLKNYPSTKPYFLSGGIGYEEIDAIKEFLKLKEARYCHAIDVNSRFEIEPGLKDTKKLKRFIEAVHLK